MHKITNFDCFSELKSIFESLNWKEKYSGYPEGKEIIYCFGAAPKNVQRAKRVLEELKEVDEMEDGAYYVPSGYVGTKGEPPLINKMLKRSAYIVEGMPTGLCILICEKLID